MIRTCSRILYCLLIACMLVSCTRNISATPQPLPTFVSPGIRDNPVLDRTENATSSISEHLGAITNYHFDVSLDYAGHSVKVSQLVEVVNPGPDVWTELIFYLPVDLQTDRFVLSTVRIKDGVEDSVTQMQVTSDGFLTFQLSKYLNPNESRMVTITYGLEATQVDLTTLSPAGDVGYSENVLQFVNWYPQLVPYRPGLGWIRWPDVDSDWNIVSEVSDYNLVVRVPDEIYVASGGPVEHRGNDWYFQMQNARSIAFSASPDYKLKTSTEAGVTIYLFHLPDDSFAADAVLNATARSLVLFNDRYGHYPYRSLVIAQNHYRSSIASGGLLLHSGQGFETYSGQPDSLLMVLVPLTLSQLWWGEVVGYDRITEPWIGASFAMYSEYMYVAEYFSDKKEWFWTDRIDYWKPDGPLNKTVYNMDNRQQMLQNTYRIGARFLHELHNEMGDPNFRRFTRDLFRSGAFQILDGTEFFNTLRKHTTEYPEEIIARYFDKNIEMPIIKPALTPIFNLGQSPTATPVQRIHEVQVGDTLTNLAIQYEVPMQMIIDRNRIVDPTILQIGTKLVIPYP